jgi:MFS family permease
MGVYQISDLKYSLTFISVISLISSFSRVLVSRFLGKLGDKKGFLYLFGFGLLLSAVSTLAVVFISPSSPTLAVIMMFVHGIILNVGVGAINNSKLNLCYDYVEPNLVADAYAFSIAIPGSIGFISSLIAGKLVDYIQGNGNTLFGIPVYAQQVLGLISTLLLLLDVLYIIFVFEKSKKN